MGRFRSNGIVINVSYRMNKQERKPYNVAKMAAVNKFLRIYYARAMELYK